MSQKESLLANPAPLGLMGFGMTTILLNLANMGLIGISSIIVAMGIFYGGLAQIIAGVMEFRKGNTFGTLAFTSYGLFWLTLVFIIISTVERPAVTPDNAAWAAYLFIWGLFTLMMFFGTLKTNRALQTDIPIACNTLLPPHRRTLHPTTATNRRNRRSLLRLQRILPLHRRNSKRSP